MIVATSAGSLGSPATPSLGFYTPRLGGSLAGSPALSDDAGATTRSPTVYSPSPLEHAHTPVGPVSSSLDLAASRGRLDHCITHMQVSPLIHDGSDSTPSQPAASPASPQIIQHWHKPSLSSASAARYCEGPNLDTYDTVVPPPPACHDDQGQKWFTEVDWFGADGPLAGLDQPVAQYGGWSVSERV